MTARELMKMISEWPGTQDFWVKMTQKFGMEARVAGVHICNCWFHLWMRTLLLLLYSKVIMEGAVLLVPVSVSQWSTQRSSWWATYFSSAIFQFYFPWTSILVKQGDQRKSLITRDRASEYSELWRITWAGLTPARMKVKVKAKQSCKGWIPKSTIPRITLTTVTVICIALDT